MKRLPLVAALLAAAHPAVSGQEPDVNVNSRYTVEAVELSPHSRIARLPAELRGDLRDLVGKNLDNERIKELGRRIRSELKARRVTPKVVKGDQPDHVKVVFETSGQSREVDLDVTKFVYHSRQGWSGQLDLSTRVGKNAFAAGIVSDGDELLERYSGYRARYQRSELGTDRVRLGFGFESYRDQWSRRTVSELSGQSGIPGVYRTRMNFQPALTLVLAEPLRLEVGASFERFQTQYPAARTEAADSVVTSLRYHEGWEDSGAGRHDLAAGYNLHAATNLLDTDFVYARHVWDASYRFHSGRNEVVLHFEAGRLTGRAPLVERFALGDSRTLRGWNKFDFTPTGGDRMATGSVEYSYRVVRIFYDTGSVWNHGQSSDVKNSLGVGLKKGGFQLAVAFPLKAGRVDAIFIAGMNF